MRDVCSILAQAAAVALCVQPVEVRPRGSGVRASRITWNTTHVTCAIATAVVATMRVRHVTLRVIAVAATTALLV
jgi:hypothetical protein